MFLVYFFVIVIVLTVILFKFTHGKFDKTINKFVEGLSDDENWSDDLKNKDVNLGKISFGIKKKIPIVLGVIALLFLLSSSVFTVKQGSVAIITRFGKVTGVKEAGLNFKLPLIKNKAAYSWLQSWVRLPSVQ